MRYLISILLLFNVGLTHSDEQQDRQSLKHEDVEKFLLEREQKSQKSPPIERKQIYQWDGATQQFCYFYEDDGSKATCP